jgi:hypothetical protein
VILEAIIQSYTNLLGSFGRTGSGEDVSDTSREQRNEDVECPAELGTSEVRKSEAGMTDCGLCINVSRLNSSKCILA